MVYWGNATATIDWCEENYEVTYYIAEFWNCISSLAITAFGVYGLMRVLQYRLETVFIVWNVIVAVVGLGSALFHGTLLYECQMADELPMMWCCGCWFYLLPQLKAGYGKLRYSIPVIAYVTAISLVHMFSKFVIVFQVHFGLLVAAGAAMTLYISYTEPCKESDQLLKPWGTSLILAAICWNLDRLLCDHVKQLLPVYPQLHAFWHVLMGYFAYVGVVWTTYRRLKYLHMKPRMCWLWNIIPYYELDKRQD